MDGAVVGVVIFSSETMVGTGVAVGTAVVVGAAVELLFVMVAFMEGKGVKVGFAVTVGPGDEEGD